MRSKPFRMLCTLSLLLMFLVACNLPGGAAPTATVPPPTATVPPQNPPTETEAPTVTATLEPAETLTPTLTLEPSITPTVALPVGDVVKEINCRVGPGGGYDLVVVFQPGDTVDIIARDLGSGFVFVKNPADPEKGCWVLENGLRVSGDLTPLPAFSPPPSPTLSPAFTVKYKNTDMCKGNPYIRFEVVNTGSIQFRSAYVKVTNPRSKEVAEQVVNAFDIMTGCIIARNIAPLTPGLVGNLQTPVFQKGSPKGQKVQAVIQLCVEQNLKGACVTQTLQFTVN